MPTANSHNSQGWRANLVPHALWLLTTLGTFIAGSHLARHHVVPDNLANGVTITAPIAEFTDIPSGSTSAIPPVQSTASSSATASLGPSALPLNRSATNQKGNQTKRPPLTKEEIEELAVTATKSSDPIERRKAFDRILEEMESDTFTREQAMMMRSSLHENGAKGEQWRAFDYAWGANDPETALAHVNEIDEKYRNGFTGNMLPGLASVEPQMAIDLVSTMEGKLNFQMTGRLIEGLADYDIGYATNYVNQLAENGNRGASHHMRQLTGEVMSTAGLTDTLSWAEGLEPGALQATALRGVAHEYTNENPQGAADWAKQFVGQDQNSRLFGEVVREWGDVAAATDWTNSLEPSLAQRDALSAVYGFRGSQEPHAALEDIMSMPSSDNKDFALNGFISGLAHQDGEAAVAWAAEIQSAGMREAAMIRAGTQFFQQDQQAASEWFNASGLPENALGRMNKPN